MSRQQLNINSHSQKLFSHTCRSERVSRVWVWVRVRVRRKLPVVLSQASHWAFAAGRVHLALHSWANFRLVNVRAAVVVVVVVWQIVWVLWATHASLSGCCCCSYRFDLIWWVIIMIAIRAVDWLGNKVIRQVWLSVTEVCECEPRADVSAIEWRSLERGEYSI